MYQSNKLKNFRGKTLQVLATYGIKQKWGSNLGRWWKTSMDLRKWKCDLDNLKFICAMGKWITMHKKSNNQGKMDEHIFTRSWSNPQHGVGYHKKLPSNVLQCRIGLRNPKWYSCLLCSPNLKKNHEQKCMFPCKVRKVVKRMKVTPISKGSMKKSFQVHHGTIIDLTLKGGYGKIQQ